MAIRLKKKNSRRLQNERSIRSEEKDIYDHLSKERDMHGKTTS